MICFSAANVIVALFSLSLQTILVVLTVVVEFGACLRRLGEVGIVGQTFGSALLLQLDAGVDLVEALLDFGGNGSWGRDVVAGGAETVLVSRVLDVDDNAFGRDVRVLAVLDESAARMIGRDVLKEASLGGVDVVAGLVRVLVAAVLALLLVVLEDWDPGGGRQVVDILVLGDSGRDQTGGQDNLRQEREQELFFQLTILCSE